MVDDTSVGILRRVDPVTHANIYNWPCPPGFQYMDTYEGVHPWKRKHVQPHQYYPLCRIYEHNRDIGVAMILWQINSSTILEEFTTVNVFQTQLMEASPRLLWLRNNAIAPTSIATAFQSPMTSMHNTSTVTPAITTTTIDSRSNVATAAVLDNTSTEIVQYESGYVSAAGNSLSNVSVTRDVPTTSSMSSSVVANTNDVIDLSIEGTETTITSVTDDVKDHGITDEMHSVLPKSRKEYEKLMYQKLKVLYTEPFKFPHIDVSIGGRMYELDCFHYVDPLNSSQPEFNNKRIKKYEFVNSKGENTTVYRWEIKMAVITSLPNSQKKYDDRVFYAFARYGSSVSGGKMYDCCAVLIIRCTNRTPVFLMMEVGSVTEEIQSWEGYEKIKHFYVMPEVPVDYDMLSRARLRYWDMNKHTYEESRLVQIDTHRPGDLTVETATTQQLSTSWKMWTIKRGPRDVIASVIVPEEDRSLPRVAQMKENAQLRDAQTSITVKNAKIVDLEKRLTLLQTQLKAKAVATSTNKRDSPAVQEDNKIVSPPLKRRIVAAATSSNDHLTLPSVYAENLGYRTRPAIVHDSPVMVEMNQELKRTELEKSINNNKIQILELQLLAAQKQAALNDARKEQAIATARHNLELSGIHIDQRELQQAARNRQNAINDEDRMWQKESARRQWLVEDRQVAANRMLDFASKAHELPMLQTLLSAQNANTALAVTHPFMRSPLNSFVGIHSSAQQQLPQQQWPMTHPTQPQQPLVAAATVATTSSSSSSGTPSHQWTPTAIPATNDTTTLVEEDFSQYEEADLSAKLLQIQSQLSEEYARLSQL